MEVIGTRVSLEWITSSSSTERALGNSMALENEAWIWPPYYPNRWMSFMANDFREVE